MSNYLDICFPITKPGGSKYWIKVGKVFEATGKAKHQGTLVLDAIPMECFMNGSMKAFLYPPKHLADKQENGESQVETKTPKDDELPF